MKPSKIIGLLLLILVHFAQAQTNNRFSKYAIGNSGCKAYFPQNPGKPDVSYSPDSAKIYTIDVENTAWGKYNFGLIIADLPHVDLKDNEEMMLMSYLDFLKTQFSIVEAAGYGKGHSLPSHPTARGVLDYWKDKTGDDWVVKGWVAEQTLVVMFIYGKPAFTNTNIQELYFNGFRFPGDD